MSEPSGDSVEITGKGFARRSYPARAIGLALGYIAVATALVSESRGWPVWVALTLYSFVWPHAAYLYSSRVPDSHVTGFRQLLFDSVCGGVWAAAMSYNLLPSVLILTMLSMNNAAAGGIFFYLKGLMAQAVGVVVGIALFGWEPDWNTSLRETIACIPFLATHPLAVGLMTYVFAERLHEQKKHLRTLSRVDGLTGVYNRRYWEARASEEFERCKRGGSAAILMLLDIDHFKNINDQHGHSMGDEVLRGFGALLTSQLRGIDVIGRYGGEEFAIVLVDASTADAERLAERLRVAAANRRFGANHSLQCTVSIGVAQVLPTMKHFGEWLNAADQALYEAKAQGRNRVLLHQ
jgi:diguanylate cyclase